MTKKADPKITTRKVIIVGALVITLLLGFWLISNKSLYVADKASVSSESVHILDAITANGTSPVYSHSADAGCKIISKEITGPNVDCYLHGAKYFKGSGSAQADLAALDSQLGKLGLKNTDKTGALSSTKPFHITYEGSHLLNIQMGFFLPTEGLDAQRYLPLPDKVDLEPGEYLYGVSLTGTYWSCHAGQIWQWPCPKAPIEPSIDAF